MSSSYFSFLFLSVNNSLTFLLIFSSKLLIDSEKNKDMEEQLKRVTDDYFFISYEFHKENAPGGTWQPKADPPTAETPWLLSLRTSFYF